MTNYEKIKSLSLDKTADFLANNFDESSYQIRDWLEEQCMQCIELMTNYRNLKSSSLDEMARILGNILLSACKMCPYYDGQGSCTEVIDMDCTDTLRDWLQAESEKN